jgi:LmbE family N-acetylglucosaminyl deacetylase
MFQFEISFVVRMTAVLLPIFMAVGCGGSSDNGDSAKSTSISQGVPGDLATHPIMSKSKLVWFGAHPDDEIYASGLLKSFCYLPGKTCVLVTLTNGRSSELVAAGSYVGATSVRQYSLTANSASTVAGVMATWNAQAGTAANLTNFIKGEIQTFAADVIVTMDPRHGTTCNADNRAAAGVVLAGAAAAGFSSGSIYMIESMIDSNGGLKEATASDNLIQTFSMTGLWSSLVHMMDVVYASQFSDSQVATLSAAPTSGQTISTLRVDQALAIDARYDNLCP